MRRIAFLLFFVIPLLTTVVRASLTPAQLGEYLESGSLIKWQTGSGDWRLESNADFTKDGVDSIRTPTLGNSSYVDFYGTVTGPGILRGWVRVSSERLQDTLGLAVNGIVRQQWSGQQTADFELAIPPGVQTLRFSWSKDASLTHGMDAAWLDQVIFIPHNFSVTEALDLPANPAPSLVQFSVPAGMSPWTSYLTPDAASGGDVLLSSPLPGNLRLGLLATLQVPAVVEFRTRRVRSTALTPGASSGVIVTFQSERGGQYLELVREGEWTIHRVLVPRAMSQININAAAGSNADEAVFLDQMRVIPALPASSLAEALDAPDQVFTANWISVSNGPALNDPWTVLPEGTTAGLGREGDMVVASQHEIQGITSFNGSLRELSTELTGPGRVNFWCRVAAASSGSNAFYYVLTSLDQPNISYKPQFQSPYSQSWSEREIEVPQGRWKVAIQWASSDVLALDQWSWTPTPDLLPAPTLENAVGTAGLSITQSGNWRGESWTDAGYTDHSAAVWIPLPVNPTTEDPTLPLRATAEGAGWATFSTLGNVRWEADGIPYLFNTSFAYQSKGAWSQVARRFPPGVHTFGWIASNAGSSRGVRLDDLSFNSNPPSWVDALDAPAGIDFWRMRGGHWQPDSSIKYNGAASLRVPVIPQYAYASVSGTFNGPGILRFRWRMETQPIIDSNNQSFSYSDNKSGLAQLGVSGAWTEGLVMFRDAGEINAFWTFRQMAGDGTPPDTAWLDDVSFTPIAPPSLAEAMDTPSLTWTSNGQAAVLSGAGLEWANGADAVRIASVPRTPAWIETTVSGSGVVSFRASQTATVSVNGTTVGNFTGQAAFRLTGPGPHVCRFGGTTELDDFQFLPLPVVTAAEALDLPSSTSISISGVLPGSYGIQDATASYDGIDAVRLEETDTTDNSTAEASLGVVLNGPCRIRFRWKSEGPGVASYGFPAVNRTGPFDWTEVDHIVLGAEVNSFLIRLDSEGVGNSKLLWIDQMVIEVLRPASLSEALQNNVSLPMAMDSPGRVWETSPENPYVGFASYEAESTWDGIDGVMPRQSTPGSWLQTTLQGPNRVSFVHKNFKGKFSINGQPLKVTATSAWAGITFETSPGSNVLRWEDTGPLDSFIVTPVQSTLADALDFLGNWRVASGPASSIVFTDTSDGQDAVFSKTNAVSGSAGFRLDVIGPGKMEFMAKTPSTNPISDLLFSENGTWQGYYLPWWSPQIIDTIPPGPQLLSWPAGNSIDSANYVARDQVHFTPYQETPLSAALDHPSLTLTTNPASPWQGWDAGSAAFDSQDAAISNGSASWLDITLPPGAGELRLMARSPIKITTQPSPFVSTTIRINNSSRNLSIPQEWKKLNFAITGADSRTVRVNPGSIYLWMDSLDFVPASETFALWRTAQGLPADVDLNSDSDGDGIPVLMEYALGLDASQPGKAELGMPADAALPIFEVVRPSGSTAYLQCRYYRRTGGRGLRYDVRFSSEPSTSAALPTSTTSVVSVNNDWERVTVRDPVNSFPGPRFGRLWVTYEP